jgi:RHS repeat-associated protein
MTATDVCDHASQLTGVTNETSGFTVLSSFSYVLDVDSRRSSCTEANSDAISYGYDWGGRLTSESRRGFTNSYGYNSNGEQTSRTLSGTAYTLSFDYDGQLASSVQGSATTSFSYDALGRRVSRTAGGTTTNFLYAGGAVLLEKQGSTYTATYTYGNALLRKDGEYPLFDGLGSERTVTSSTQSVAGTLTLDGFGLTVNTTGSSTDPYMFGAVSRYRNDGDAGLMQVGARYYDAQVGRFITRDTDLTQYPYIYCGGDPVNAVDPTGNGPQWLEDLWSDLPKSVQGLLGKLTVITALGGVAEAESPPGTIVHRIGGTVAGAGFILVGLGYVASATLGAAGILAGGEFLIGAGFFLYGAYHVTQVWQE